MNENQILLNTIDRKIRHELREHVAWLRRMGLHDDAGEIDEVLKRPLRQVLSFIRKMEMQDSPKTRLELQARGELEEIEVGDWVHWDWDVPPSSYPPCRYGGFLTALEEFRLATPEELVIFGIVETVEAGGKR